MNNEGIVMAGDDEDKKWAAARLNSMLNELKEGPKLIFGDVSNVSHYIPRRFVKVHEQIKEKFPDNDGIPPVLEPEEMHEEYQYAKLYYIYTTINEIANALGITLKEQGNKDAGQIITQYSNQQVTQINVQTTENLIENINKLDIRFDTKTEIVNLVKEFDDEVKNKKDPNKLKEILLKVGKLSFKAGALLFEHAEELGLLSLLLSI